MGSNGCLSQTPTTLQDLLKFLEGQSASDFLPPDHERKAPYLSLDTSLSGNLPSTLPAPFCTFHLNAARTSYAGGSGDSLDSSRSSIPFTPTPGVSSPAQPAHPSGAVIQAPVHLFSHTPPFGCTSGSGLSTAAASDDQAQSCAPAAPPRPSLASPAALARLHLDELRRCNRALEYEQDALLGQLRQVGAARQRVLRRLGRQGAGGDRDGEDQDDARGPRGCAAAPAPAAGACAGGADGAGAGTPDVRQLELELAAASRGATVPAPGPLPPRRAAPLRPLCVGAGPGPSPGLPCGSQQLGPLRPQLPPHAQQSHPHGWPRRDVDLRPLLQPGGAPAAAAADPGVGPAPAPHPLAAAAAAAQRVDPAGRLLLLRSLLRLRRRLIRQTEAEAQEGAAGTGPDQQDGQGQPRERQPGEAARLVACASNGGTDGAGRKRSWDTQEPAREPAASGCGAAAAATPLGDRASGGGGGGRRTPLSRPQSVPKLRALADIPEAGPCQQRQLRGETPLRSARGAAAAEGAAAAAGGGAEGGIHETLLEAAMAALQEEGR